MLKIRLFHWNAAEASDRAARLMAAGYDVDFDLPSPATLKNLRAEPPDAVLIDLDRLPAQGRDVGVWLRTHKATRSIPLVFVGGKPEKLVGVKKILPDATYTSWSKIKSPLKRAIAHPPENPINPKSVFAAYSGTPLPKKLGIKAGAVIGLVGAPTDFEKTLGILPEGVSLKFRVRSRCDMIVWFTRSQKDVKNRLARMSDRSGRDGLWIVWPKKASGEKTDLTQPVVRKLGLAAGLVDYKVCSIDKTWTGLKFTTRKKRT